MSSSLVTNSDYLIDLNSGANTLSIAGTVAITGNLSVSGNSTLSGNILGDRIQNGTTSIDIQTANGNANISIGGISNIAVFATTGEYINGLLSVTGNVTANNGMFTNIVNVASHTGTLVSVTGNITANNLAAVNLVINNIRSDDSTFVTIEDGVDVNGEISATGNITGNYILGNGSQLTSINAVTVDITDTNGLTTVYYPTFVENRTTAQIARADVDLTYRTDDNLLTVGNVSVTGNITANNGMFTTIVNTASFTGGLVSVTGNITAGNILTGGLISVAGNITAGNLDAVNLVINSIASDDSSFVTMEDGVNVNGEISATGNITGGNISTDGAVKTGSFVTGTIPAAAGVGAGARAFVTDADSVTFGNLYTGGSGNAVPVYSNGTNWYIG